MMPLMSSVAQARKPADRATALSGQLRPGTLVASSIVGDDAEGRSEITGGQAPSSLQMHCVKPSLTSCLVSVASSKAARLSSLAA